MSEWAAVFDLNINLNKAFDTINHECVNLKVMELM